MNRSKDIGTAYEIALPAGLTVLNANQRMHYQARATRTRVIREAAFVAARIVGLPSSLGRCRVIGIYDPPDRRKRDAANLYPTFKAAIDGLVDAGVWPDDDDRYVIGPDMRLGEVTTAGRIRLRLEVLGDPIEGAGA